MGYAKIILIDHNDDRINTANSILQFIEYETEVITDSDQLLNKNINWNDLLVILLGDSDDQSYLETNLANIKIVAPKMPIVLFSDSTNTNKPLPEGVIGRIELPFKYTTLISALHKVQIYKESHRLKENQRSLNLFRSLVGDSKAIQHVRTMIEQVADSEATVLVLGESGTGKEVVARNIHYHSNRKEKPFVPINCGAIPPDLLESELFGHEKGAFTGALTTRQGRFEMAHNGTLFLDEIGDMPMPMQVKLLRVLQERTFERVGSNKSITINVRVVAATHRNLESMISENKFREDLFYRLNVFPIELPALNERTEDIPLLLNDLISRVESQNRGSVRLTPAAIIGLGQYHWPGNIRELANLVERLAILFPYGVVDVTDLPEKFRTEEALASAQQKAMDGQWNEPKEQPNDAHGIEHLRLPADGIDLKDHLWQLECSLIKQALDEAGGVVAHAAKRLKMRRTTLVEKLRKYGLQRAESTLES